MDFERTRKQDAKGRIYEALGKTKETQARLNAAATFVDPKEQLKELEVTGANAAMYGMLAALRGNANTKGIHTTISPRILDNYIPVYNAYIVDKLQVAGAAVTAKVSTDKLDMGGISRSTYTGPVNNAWDESRISGGSSGGGAALAAAGVVPFAIGTGTGDGVRRPAVYQGIIGVRSTYGRTSRYGIIPYTSSLDHVGYFTTPIWDTVVALEVLADRDDHDMTLSSRAMEVYAANLSHDLREKRIAVLDSVQEAVASPAIHGNFDALVKKLETRGTTVAHMCMDDKSMKALMPIYYIVASAEAVANRSDLDGIRFGMCKAGENVEDVMINTRIKGFCPYVRKRFAIGSYPLFVKSQDKIFRKAQKVRRLIVEELNRVLANSDVVIVSAAGTIVPLVEESKGSHLGVDNNVVENHMVLGNFTGYPGMTMPTGLAESTPIGISIAARASDEQTLFSIRSTIEERTGLKGDDVEVDA